MKPKVLILPTYWPTPNKPIIGAQIKEQSELMLDDFDVKALYCMPGMGIKRFLIFLSIGKLLKTKGYVRLKTSEENRIDTIGVYYYNSRFFPEKINAYLKKLAYLYSYKECIKMNWFPELIHSRGFEYGGEAAYQINNKYGLPYLHTENTAFLFDKTFSLYRLKLYKKVLSNAACINTVSNFLLRNTLMHGFLTQQSFYNVGNPINEMLFKPNSTQKNDKQFRVLITGYNAYIKDYYTFFNAIKLLVQKGHTNVKAVIAMTYGDYKSREALIKTTKHLNINEYCEFHLEVPRNNMPALINSCHVCVSTSLIETFGIGMLEAMFCGIPVVSTRNGGVDEFISDKSGILCDIGDYDGISEAIDKIMTKEIKFSSKEIRESVIHKYSSTAFRKKLKSIYLSIIN